MSDWIATADRLPEQGRNVLLAVADSHVEYGKLVEYSTGLEWSTHEDNCHADLDFYTHWMELPKAPEVAA